VHNQFVVENLKSQGAIFVEELSEIKDKSRPVIFSAHGVPKEVINEAKLNNIIYIDATCPLVTKVHREAETLAKEEYNIIFIGHKNHPEVIGTMGQIDNNYICYATTNRQEAVKKIAKKCDLFLVVGSKSSSNSQRLVEVAKRFGCKESILMHSDQELPVDKIKNSKNIGITSGASAPEILVENLIKEIKSVTNVKLEEVITSVENVSFKLPTILIK